MFLFVIGDSGTLLTICSIHYTINEEILNGKLHFLCSDINAKKCLQITITYGLDFSLRR